jgi:hypothetical protein
MSLDVHKNEVVNHTKPMRPPPLFSPGMHPVRGSVVHWPRYEGNTIAMSKKAFEKKNSSGLKIFCIFAIELLQKKS